MVQYIRHRQARKEQGLQRAGFCESDVVWDVRSHWLGGDGRGLLPVVRIGSSQQACLGDLAGVSGFSCCVVWILRGGTKTEQVSIALQSHTDSYRV